MHGNLHIGTMFCSIHVRRGHVPLASGLYPLDFHVLQPRVVVGALLCTIPAYTLLRNSGTFHIDIRTFVLALSHLVLHPPGYLHLNPDVAPFRFRRPPLLAASCLRAFSGLFSGSISLLLAVPLLILDPHRAAPPAVQI